MFADSALAARIDRAEGRMCAQFARHPAPETRRSETLVLPIGGGQAIYTGHLSPVNKVIGLGFDGPLDPDELTRIEEAWRRREEPVRIELAILTPPELGGMLVDRGYRLHGFENVLGRTLRDALREVWPANLTIDTVQSAEEGRIWLDIAVEAFMNLDGTGSVPDDALPRDHLMEALGPYTDIPDIVRYLARIDGEPVGEAAMRIDGDIAQLAGAGTLPSFRGRGVQKALLHRRLTDALAGGCRLAVVTTAPGTRSQENVMRRGFELLYARAILVKTWNTRGRTSARNP